MRGCCIARGNQQIHNFKQNRNAALISNSIATASKQAAAGFYQGLGTSCNSRTRNSIPPTTQDSQEKRVQVLKIHFSKRNHQQANPNRVSRSKTHPKPAHLRAGFVATFFFGLFFPVTEADDVLSAPRCTAQNSTAE